MKPSGQLLAPVSPGLLSFAELTVLLTRCPKKGAPVFVQCGRHKETRPAHNFKIVEGQDHGQATCFLFSYIISRYCFTEDGCNSAQYMARIKLFSELLRARPESIRDSRLVRLQQSESLSIAALHHQGGINFYILSDTPDASASSSGLLQSICASS